MKLLFTIITILAVSLGITTYAMEQEESASKKMKTAEAEQAIQRTPAKIPSLVQLGLTSVAKYVKEGKIQKELLSQLPENIEEAVKFLINAQILTAEEINTIKKSAKSQPIPELVKQEILKRKPVGATQQDFEIGLMSVLAYKLEKSFSLKDRFARAVQNAVLKLNIKTPQEEQTKIQKALDGLINLVKEDVIEALATPEFFKWYLARAGSSLDVLISGFAQLFRRDESEIDTAFFYSKRQNALKMLQALLDANVVKVNVFEELSDDEENKFVEPQLLEDQQGTNVKNWGQVVIRTLNTDLILKLITYENLKNDVFIRETLLYCYELFSLPDVQPKNTTIVPGYYIDLLMEVEELLKIILPIAEKASHDIQKSYIESYAHVRYDIVVDGLRKSMNLLDDYKNGKISENQLIKALRQEWDEENLKDAVYDAKQAQQK